MERIQVGDYIESLRSDALNEMPVRDYCNAHSNLGRGPVINQCEQ